MSSFCVNGSRILYNFMEYTTRGSKQESSGCIDSAEVIDRVIWIKCYLHWLPLQGTLPQSCGSKKCYQNVTSVICFKSRTDRSILKRWPANRRRAASSKTLTRGEVEHEAWGLAEVNVLTMIRLEAKRVRLMFSSQKMAAGQMLR